MGEANFYYFTCLKLNLDSIKDFSCKNDETHAKSRNYWQVRHALWCLAEEDREEDGSVAARDLYLSLLWKGCPQTTSSRHLVLQSCRKTIAGGAWTHSTTAAVTVR